MVALDRIAQEPRPPVQGLVYIFIALAAVAIGATAYFGLTFTPIEAFVTALVFGTIAVVMVERQLRRRAEARLEKGIEDLSRLLATDAQAGNVLSQRVNAIVDQNAGKRLEGLEADLSVLGTAVRQVAAAVVDLEEIARGRDDLVMGRRTEPEDDSFPEPAIALDALRKALNEGRLVCHVEPIARLPSRQTNSFDVVPRLVLEDGEIANPPDFLPRRGGTDLIVRIEGSAFDEGLAIARNSVTARRAHPVYLPISRATLGSIDAMEALIATLDSNRSICDLLLFSLPESEWNDLTASDRAGVGNIARRGVGFSMSNSSTLRFDFGELQGLGFRSVRVDTSRFIGRPEQFTDFHISDVADYARRYGIEIIGTGAIGDQQLMALHEAGVVLAQGPVIGGPVPTARHDPAPRSGLARRRA